MTPCPLLLHASAMLKIGQQISPYLLASKCFETLNHFKRNCFILLQWFRKLRHFHLQLSTFRHLGCLSSRPHLTETNHRPVLKQHPPITVGLLHTPYLHNLKEKKLNKTEHTSTHSKYDHRLNRSLNELLPLTWRKL